MDGLDPGMEHTSGDRMGDGSPQSLHCQVCGGSLQSSAEVSACQLLCKLDRERMERVVATYGQEITTACASCFIPLATVANGSSAVSSGH
jgi:hypothetical protein